MASTLADLLARDDAVQSAISLRANLGDGILCKSNRIYSRVRRQALQAGYEFNLNGSESYFGWPLVSLDTVLSTKEIPYRNNRAGLVHLEESRPGYFRIRDLNHNRPLPNYLLHESAHAVAFERLFDTKKEVGSQLRERRNLTRVLLGESFAMTAEYFAACCVNSPTDQWLFSINSYRHRVPGKSAIAELISERGGDTAAAIVLLTFLQTNSLVSRLRGKDLERLFEILGEPSPRTSEGQRLLRHLNELMKMNPLFLRDTTRLFLGSLGYPREVERLLEKTDAWDELCSEPKALRQALSLAKSLRV